MDKLNLRIRMLRRFGVEVHPILFAGLDGVDEFASRTAKIEDRTIVPNKGLKKGFAEFIPDFRAIFLQSPESQFVF